SWFCWCWRRLCGGTLHGRFNRFDPMPMADAVNLELNFLAYFLVQQRLSYRRQVADDALIRISIPGAENSEGLGLLGGQISRADDCAHVDHISPRIGEITAARADELAFQLRLAAHKQPLHFLGRLVFVIFPEVAVAAGDGDLF